MRRPRWPLHAGRFVQLYCSLTWDDSYASSCSGCGPPGAANMRNDMYHGELGNSAATKLHTIRASSKTCLVIFSRSVGVNLLLNCYTVAATQTLSISPSLPSSLVRYTNRPSPSGHQTRYAKRLTIIQALLWTAIGRMVSTTGTNCETCPNLVKYRAVLVCTAKPSWWFVGTVYYDPQHDLCDTFADTLPLLGLVKRKACHISYWDLPWWLLACAW